MTASNNNKEAICDQVCKEKDERIEELEDKLKER